MKSKRLEPRHMKTGGDFCFQIKDIEYRIYSINQKGRFLVTCSNLGSCTVRTRMIEARMRDN